MEGQEAKTCDDTLKVEFQTKIAIWGVDLEKVETDEIRQDLNESRSRNRRRIIEAVS